MILAADIVEHKGPAAPQSEPARIPGARSSGSRRYPERVRKKLAWVSIVRDARGILQLPPAQEDDAKKKLAEQETAALNAVRRGWKHCCCRKNHSQPALTRRVVSISNLLH